MNKEIRDSIKSATEDLIHSGLNTCFSEKDLKKLDIKLPKISIGSTEIQSIRKKVNLSQAVFAKLLNVSPSSVKHWEQGNRTPTGSTIVLLNLLEKDPDILNYRIG